jgi:NAD(P)-dependent dehydrogenase (short-subunit alcohol dehydrogenase family)
MTVSNAAFAGKVAFVTGAGSGIGRATAVAFAHAGARVALADRSPDGLRETARVIEEAGGQALALTCDVCDIFPMTHHVECVAILEPAAKGF